MVELEQNLELTDSSPVISQVEKMETQEAKWGHREVNSVSTLPIHISQINSTYDRIHCFTHPRWGLSKTCHNNKKVVSLSDTIGVHVV